MLDHPSDGDRRRLRRALIGAPLGLAAAIAAMVALASDRLDLAGYAMLTIAAVGLVFAAPNGVRYWRGQSPESRRLEPPPWWQYSRALWLGNLRSTPVLAWGGMLSFVLFGVTLLIQHRGSLFGVDIAARTPAIVAVTVLFVMAGLALAVIGFNRPRQLVPPHLREGDGWFTMVLDERERDEENG
jgi:hypothetical protein